MTENSDFDFLGVIHELQSTSSDAQKTLDLAVANGTDGTATIPTTAAAALSSLLAIQTKLINKLVEENQEIKDRLVALAENRKTK